MSDQFDKGFKRFVINSKVPLPVMAQYAGVERPLSYYGNSFCPFHDNFDTPAAKLYQDEDGDTLFCFAERKRYKSYDFIAKGLVKDITDKMFTGIWSQLSEDEKNSLLSKYGEQGNYLSDNDKSRIEELALFRAGSISYKEVRKIIARMD